MKKYLSLACLALTMLSCKKYLDEKPDKSLLVPASLQDLQALLDDNTRINQNQNSGIGEVSADNYYLTDVDYNALLTERERSAYTWNSEIYYDAFPNDWSNLYAVVNRANTVLDKLKTIDRTATNGTDWDNVKGSALFIRSEAFFVLARNFCNAFDSTTANNNPGIPLRLQPNFNETSVRSSLNETYAQILTDLKTAAAALPNIPKHVLRPSKPAAYALLSRVSLSMRDYQHAGLYADSCLKIFNTLIDYNTLNASASLPFAQFNNETIYYAHGSSTQIAVGRGKIDSLLYKSFAANDLRKSVFFIKNSDGTFSFKGHYSGIASTMFVGIATDEVYLTKAECLARAGNTTEALNTLDSLLIKRWKSGTFVPLTAPDAPTALNMILTERRKELMLRDLRWMDIKRLNREGANISLTRTVNGQTYVLTPNDPKFALPIPAYVISLTGMQQNPR